MNDIPPDDFGFEEFWKAYPDFGPDKKRGNEWKGPKVTARKAFMRVKIKDRPALITAVLQYRRQCESTETRACYAATWLNQSRWTEVETKAEQSKTVAPGAYEFLVVNWLRSGNWPVGCGADPMQPSTKVPDAVMLKFAHLPETIRKAHRYNQIHGDFPNWYVDESIPV